MKLVSTSEPIACKVAVVGAGSMAREHIRAFAAVPGVTIVGLHSRTRQRAESLAGEFGISTVCDSVEELYSKTRPDLVVVAVFELAMEEVSRECFKFPWTILLEKPPGYDLTTAQRIVTSAKDNSRKVYVGLNRRCMSTTRKALEEAASVEGRRFISVADQQDTDAAIEMGQPMEVVRNLMYSNSIHVIDYFSVFGRGAISKVSNVVPWKPDDPFIVLSKIEFDSGDIGLYQGIWNGPGPWSVTITCASKRWELRPLEQLHVQHRGERKTQPVLASSWDSEFKPGFRLQAEMAVKAAIGQPSELPTLDGAMTTMKLIHSIFNQN